MSKHDMSDNPLSPLLAKKAARDAEIQAKLESAIANKRLFDQLRVTKDSVKQTLQELSHRSSPMVEDYAKTASVLERQLRAVWEALRTVEAIDRITAWQ